MPGSPVPVLGSEVLSGAIAIALAAGIVHVVLGVDRISEGSVLVVLGVALLYGLVLMGAWFALLLVAGLSHPAADGWVPLDTIDLLVTLKVGFVGLFAQAVVPLYLYATWSLVGPIAVWFVGTAAAVFTITRLGGEGPGPFFYTLLAVPVVVASAVVVALIEVAVRVLA